MEALLLDLDRTLVDLQSFTDYGAAVRDLRSELDPEALAVVGPTESKEPTSEAQAILLALAGRPETWQLASDLIEIHELAVIDRATPMPHMKTFLDASADLPRAIVTLMGPAAADAVCARFGIDVPVRMGRQAHLRVKPAPDQVLAACAALSVAPDAATMIGDSAWDEGAALAAGAGFIGITNGTANHFDGTTMLAKDLNEARSLLGI